MYAYGKCWKIINSKESRLTDKFTTSWNYITYVWPIRGKCEVRVGFWNGCIIWLFCIIFYCLLHLRLLLALQRPNKRFLCSIMEDMYFDDAPDDVGLEGIHAIDSLYADYVNYFPSCFGYINLRTRSYYSIHKIFFCLRRRQTPILCEQFINVLTYQ